MLCLPTASGAQLGPRGRRKELLLGPCAHELRGPHGLSKALVARNQGLGLTKATVPSQSPGLKSQRPGEKTPFQRGSTHSCLVHTLCGAEGCTNCRCFVTQEGLGGQSLPHTPCVGMNYSILLPLCTYYVECSEAADAVSPATTLLQRLLTQGRAYANPISSCCLLPQPPPRLHIC